MAKIDKPLFGDEASGSIAGLLTFRTRGGKTETMQQRKSTRDHSTAQEVQRARFSTAHAAWMLLPKQEVIINNRHYMRRVPGWTTFWKAWPAPNAPSNLNATATSASEITLSWTDNSDNETGFKIERKTGSGGTWAQIATTAANVTSYNNTGLSQGTTYYYRVRASNVVGNSEFTNEAHDTTWIPATPAAPSNLTATSISETRIDLAWTDTSNNETGFKVERKTGSGGTWTQIDTTGANVEAYQNTNLSAGTTYYYRIRAFNNNGNSDYSNEANTTTLQTECVFTITPGLPINGTWTTACVSTHRSGRYAKFYTLSTTEPAIGTFDLSSTVDTYLFLLNGTGTQGTIIAQDDDSGEGSNSRITQLLQAGNYTLEATTYASAETGNFTITAILDSEAPAAPSNLNASAISGSRISLSWNDNSENEAGFKIERYTGTSEIWEEIATTAANVTSYNSTGLSQGTTYYYRVRAYNEIGNSSYSNGASATTETVECVFTITPNTPIDDTWTVSCESKNRSGSYAKYYTFSITTEITGVFDLISSIDTYLYLLNGIGTEGAIIAENDDYGGGVNSRITQLLEPGDYTLEATTYEAEITGDFTISAIITSETPAAPSNLEAVQSYGIAIDLTWQINSSNTTGLKIERKTGSEGIWEQIDAITQYQITYHDENTTESTEYYYRIRATNPIGDSGYSNEANANSGEWGTGG